MSKKKMPNNFKGMEKATPGFLQSKAAMVHGEKQDISNCYTSNLSYEIRNPLTSIGLSMELLESTISDPVQKIYLEIIRRSSCRINNLVNLLLLSKQEGENRQERSIHNF